MNTTELEMYLQRYNTQSTKIIVCAIDQLPKKLNPHYNYGLVINLSRGNEIGSHWTSAYINKERICSYHDSFAFRPRSWYLTDFFKKNCVHVEYSSRQIQQLNSKVCGMYAASFIIHMISGGNLKSFIDKFSKNLLINDIFINKNFYYYLRN